jgi:membrane protein
MDLRQGWNLVKTAVQSWIDDYAPSMGAALAYYTLFSVAPLLLIVISVAGLVFGQDAARGEIVSQLQSLMGNDAAKAVEGLLASVNQPSKGVLSTIVGVVVLLIGATTVFGELQDALDRIWRAPARKKAGLWGLLRARVLSFGLILGVGFLLIASLVVSAALSALGKWWAPVFGGWEVLAQVVNFAVSFGLITAIFAMIYKIMPRVHIQWHDVWIGSAVTALLFTIGKFLIGLYIGRSGVASGFGAAASLVVLLIWVYYSAQIFLLGAEFTWAYAHAHGSLKGQPIPARAGTAAEAKTGATPTPARAPAPSMPAPGRAAPTAARASLPVAPTSAAPAPRVASPALELPAHAGSLKEQAVAYLRRDPVKGVGVAVASGMALRFVVGLAGRVLLRRVHARARPAWKHPFSAS